MFRDRLAAIARQATFAQGTRLLRQGEPARGAFLLLEGEVEAQLALPGGGMLSVARLGAGEIFGEMALVERGVCSASVVACTPVQAWFVAREDFRAMVAGRDPAALALQREVTRVLAAKVRALNAKVREHPAQEDRPAQAVPGRMLDESPQGQTTFAWRLFLPALPFFDGFEAADIDEFVAGARPLEAPRGRVLFSAGTPAQACYVVIRGAVEVVSVLDGLERRVALAGPGELLGYLALLEDAPHAAQARVRESAVLLELPAREFLRHFEGETRAAVRLQHAIHRCLLRALARTNTQLTRLISAAQLRGARAEGARLEAARASQIVDLVEQPH